MAGTLTRQETKNETLDSEEIAKSIRADVANREADTDEPTRKRRGVLGQAWHGAMKLIRRIHLYAGLLMFPWVLLYGFTALLFNHSTFFPDTGTSIQYFQLADEADLPKASDVAKLVVDELNKNQKDEGGAHKYRLVNPDFALFTRQAFASTQTKKKQHTVVVNLADRSGYVRTRTRNVTSAEERRKRDEGKTPLQRGQSLRIDTGEMKSGVQTLMNEQLEDLDDSPTVAFRSLPTVEFDVEEDGKVYRVRFAASRRRRRTPPRTRPSTSSKGKKGKQSNKGRRSRKGRTRRPSSSQSAVGKKQTSESKSAKGSKESAKGRKESAKGSKESAKGRKESAKGSKESAKGSTKGRSSRPRGRGNMARSQGNRRGEGNPRSFRNASLQSGRVSVIGEGNGQIGWRRYLLRLHMAHGYPVQKNVRWYWAVCVDAMFATMVFWGFSGLLMWWQIKRTRLLGAIFLIISAVVATWLAIGMHTQLAG